MIKLVTPQITSKRLDIGAAPYNKLLRVVEIKRGSDFKLGQIAIRVVGSGCGDECLAINLGKNKFSINYLDNVEDRTIVEVLPSSYQLAISNYGV